MGCGMVRKVDELGRVVIPKEMRRILNIKTGSSVEMIINENNDITLKKFSEIKHIFDISEILLEVVSKIVFSPILICDDDEVISCKNISKKEYIGAKIIQKNFCQKKSNLSLFENKTDKFDFSYIFEIKSSGVICGYLVILNQIQVDDEILLQVDILIEFVSKLLEF